MSTTHAKQRTVPGEKAGSAGGRRGGMVRNLIHLGMGQVATTMLTILLSATLGRKLGPADFGLLYLVMSIATFAYVVVDWGHGPLIIRETARNFAKAGDLLGSSMVLRAVGALIACVVAVGITWVLGYDLRTRVLAGAMIVGSLPQYLGLSFGWVFRGRERMDRDAMLNVVLKLSTLIGAIACLALGGRLLGLVFTSSLAGCLTLAVALTMYKKLNLPVISASRSTARELVREGAPLFMVSVAIAIEPYFNANILYNMASPVVVGWYGAAWNIAGTLVAPATILGATMYPRLSMASGDATEFKRIFDISFRPLLLLALLGAVGTYLFADVAIGLIYGLNKFGPAADTLRAFAPALLLMYVDVFFVTVIMSAGKVGRLARFKVVAVVFTTTLVFLLVPYCQKRWGNGGLGVMYAMSIGELWMLGAAGMLIRHLIDARTLGDIGRSLVSGAATVLFFRLLPAMSPFLAIPLCVLLFGGLSLLVGAIRRPDIEMLLKSFRKAPAAQNPSSKTGGDPASPAIASVDSSDRAR